MSNQGKQIAGYTYLHVSALNKAEAQWQQALVQAEALADLQQGTDYNVVKFSLNASRLTLLDYIDFFEQAFPLLRRYWTIDLDTGNVRFRTYENSLNPPILHRKELLLTADDERRTPFAALTAQAEEAGLFLETTRIGFRQAWEDLLRQKGYRVAGHELTPLGNDEGYLEKAPAPVDAAGIARHRTALKRYGFSVPVQTLARFGFLDGTLSLFDYGCGRGDDLNGLLENGINASGWDPYYAPDQPKKPADIVNLGFVINVIENQEERQQALQCAYALAGKLLVVSAMLSHSESLSGKPYADGIITARNTFQKYHTQTGLRDYIGQVLDEEPVAVGPGIFYVFKDKDTEQCFQSSRQENRRNVLRLTQLSRPEKPVSRDKAGDKYQRHKAVLESLWQTCLTLGRYPDRGELAVAQSELQAFGSLSQALRFIMDQKQDSQDLLERAKQSRCSDLSVYFAQLQFGQRKPYSHLESRLQRDIKNFFGDYQAALEVGRALLFSAGQQEVIAAACQTAAESGLGFMEAGKSLTLPTDKVVQLPTVLRAYVVCGLQVYGDVGSADLIKIHIRSGKLTLMNFDDFTGSPLPRLLLRVKIKLREQDIDIFEYGSDYLPPYLYLKSRYINEESPHYAEQVAFDEHLQALGLFDLSGYGPDAKTFDTILAQYRWQSNGFQWQRTTNIPLLDAPCGRYLTYRQLIECGETQADTRLANVPENPESYTALLDLAIQILDPVIDYFGMIDLTYGFCSTVLAKNIPARIAPKLDQHAACELNRLGKPVCPRLGAAVDFIIADENMEEVAGWIATHLPYDRLYYYGKDKPLHVSYGPEQTRQFVDMLPGPSGKRIPRVRRSRRDTEA